MKRNCFNNMLAIASIIVSFVSLIIAYCTFKYKSEEEMLAKENILLDLPSNKTLPPNILHSIRIGSSVEFVRNILGVPEITNNNTLEYFDAEDLKKPTPYMVYSYFFKNADLKIISEDNITISAIVIQRGSENYSIDIPNMKNVSLGRVTVGRMLDICGGKPEREVGWLGRGDITYAAQCKFGRDGQYLWYSFGYFDPEGYDPETGEFEHKNFENKKVQFFTVSSSPRFASSVLEKSLHEIIVE